MMFTLSASYHWLITGGAGFIGSHLARELVRQGQRVTILDNLSSGNLTHLQDVQDKISFIQADICDFPTLLKAFYGVDFVLHHAALISVAKSMEKPCETARINVGGTSNVLEAARQNKVKRVLFASSAAVYGTCPDFPYTENTPIDCQSPYAWSKQTGAELCQFYTKVYGLETVVLRYFNVFGKGQNPNVAYAAVIAKFMQRAREGKPLEIDWDGLQSRDFVNVADVVQANLLAIFKARPGETYNVAYGKTYTLLELADMIEKIAGRKLQKIARPKRAGDVHASSADISKIRQIGYEPSIPLEEGLLTMWKEFFK